MVSPVYIQIHNQIKKDIEAGKWKIGEKIPSARKKVQEKMSGITSFTEITEAQGKVPTSKTVSYLITIPSLSESEKLNLDDNQKVLRMERIRFADDVPICFEVATVPLELVKDY